MACLGKCHQNAITIKSEIECYNAMINETLCVNCNACRNVCPRNDKKLALKYPISWFQGWAKKNDIRKASTSGGVASAIMSAFIKAGGYVCSCYFDNGRFIFKVSSNEEDIPRFAGSKYVKSDPTGVYKAVQDLLNANKNVLFIGLPCQVAALKKYIAIKLQRNLYAIDLICHGTPAPTVFEKYLKDKGHVIQNLNDISFRSKGSLSHNIDSKAIVASCILDRYIYSFLKKIIFTENCYSCQFASIYRVSDLTLGDSWGSKLGQDELRQGISLLLIQTDKGKNLVDISSLNLFNVNLDIAVKNNAQLQKPAEMPKEREKFIKLFKRGVSYDCIIFRVAPLVCLKQYIKMMLSKSHLIKSAEDITYKVCVFEKK